MLSFLANFSAIYPTRSGVAIWKISGLKCLTSFRIRRDNPVDILYSGRPGIGIEGVGINVPTWEIAGLLMVGAKMRTSDPLFVRCLTRRLSVRVTPSAMWLYAPEKRAIFFGTIKKFLVPCLLLGNQLDGHAHLRVEFLNLMLQGSNSY